MTAVLEKPEKKDRRLDPPSRPHVELGETVLWYHNSQDKNCKPQAAFVAAYGIGSILSLCILGPNDYNFRLRSCLHVDDPMLETGDRRSEGSWDVSPLSKRLSAIEETLARLEKRG